MARCSQDRSGVGNRRQSKGERTEWGYTAIGLRQPVCGLTWQGAIRGPSRVAQTKAQSADAPRNNQAPLAANRWRGFHLASGPG